MIIDETTFSFSDCHVYSPFFYCILFRRGYVERDDKGIDIGNKTILFCFSGTEDIILLTVGNAADLKKICTERIVQFNLAERDGTLVVQGMKTDRRRVMQGY